MGRNLHYLILHFGSFILSVSAVNIIPRPCCCQNPGDDCGLISRWFSTTGQPPPQPKWAVCTGRPPPGEQWACENPDLDFPTVDCLIQDLRTCNVAGSAGTNQVFYSFGTETASARTNIRDKLQPRGIMFNDGLMSDEEKGVGWADRILYNSPRFNLGDKDTRVSDPSKSSFRMNRQNIFVARMSEALARVATGEVFMVYLDFVGEGGLDNGLGGIYQLPLNQDANPDPNPELRLPNFWKNFELGPLQRNRAVTKITGVEQNADYRQRTEWEPGPGYREVPDSYAMNLELPPIPAQPVAAVPPVCLPEPLVPIGPQPPEALRRRLTRRGLTERDGYDACAFYENTTSTIGTGTVVATSAANPTESSTGTSSSESALMTSPPATSTQAMCTYVGEEPPAINTAYCSCSGAQTLPLTSIPGSAVPEESSCAYKTLPSTSADISITNGLGPATTDKSDCMAGSRYAINGGDMTSIPGCFPQTAQATVEAGSSPVHVGTLTGTALYTSISSALESICPSVSQTTSATVCETDAVTINDIDYVDPVDGTLARTGELVVQVQSSSYNVTSLRDAMIKSAALTAQNSANGSNCYSAKINVISKRNLWRSFPLTTLPKRWLSRKELGPTLPQTSSPLNKLFGRVIGPEEVQEKMELCNAASFAGVQYYSPYWRTAENAGSTDWIDAEWNFKVGTDGELQCDFIAGLIDALGAVQPEFEEAAVELSEGIEVLCQKAMDHD